MAAGDPATKGTRESTAIVLNMFSQNIMVLLPKLLFLWLITLITFNGIVSKSFEKLL